MAVCDFNGVDTYYHPSRFAWDNLGTTLGLVAPLILTACALTPVFLAGREGIDLSVGPAMGFISVVMVKIFMMDLGITNPLLIVPLALGLGAMIGVINGYIALYIRVQPIVTTLGSYLVLSGLASWILPAPMGPVPEWLRALSEGYSILPLLAAGLFWLWIKRLPLYMYILTLGGEDRAVYASGINVNFIRLLTYVIAGGVCGAFGNCLNRVIGVCGCTGGTELYFACHCCGCFGRCQLSGGQRHHGWGIVGGGRHIFAAKPDYPLQCVIVCIANCLWLDFSISGSVKF